eukprot:TRINITY_DN1796_c0_g1_i3.p1 TRINITY_DN1796_c0_g1~~TRINITY_DN1796_c0_g1_i3.p1  ORF type:complete len:1271 (+),score=382.42 TRINITY_DN1796_c0_g1_i3:220-3813(+)
MHTQVQLQSQFPLQAVDLPPPSQPLTPPQLPPSQPLTPPTTTHEATVVVTKEGPEVHIVTEAGRTAPGVVRVKVGDLSIATGALPESPSGRHYLRSRKHQTHYQDDEGIVDNHSDLDSDASVDLQEEDSDDDFMHASAPSDMDCFSPPSPPSVSSLDSDFDSCGPPRKRRVPEPVRTSSRHTQRKSYKEIDELDGLDEEERRELTATAATTLEGDSIEQVLDHRRKADFPEVASPSDTKWEEDIEYCIKWKNYSHIHNTWEDFASCATYNGVKKVQNYIKHRRAEIQYSKSATADSIENLAIQHELRTEFVTMAQKVERVVSSRAVDKSEENPQGMQYFVKWQCLPYSGCTWENPNDIAAFQPKIDAFLQREQAQLPKTVARPLEYVKLTKQPDGLQGGTLRDYQLEGVNWLTWAFCNGVNGILADEMGLGKTIQAIVFLYHLITFYNVRGPHLIVVPLSTLTNWAQEFTKWAPSINTVVYQGDSQSRQVIREFEFHGTGGHLMLNVLLTTYDFVLKDKSALGNIRWKYLIVDEAHRLKNCESQLHEILKEFKTSHRLLITGTPLQNSLRELWSLLNFLMPARFSDLSEFEQRYSVLERCEQISQLHAELKPFLLRRLKREVEKSLPQKKEQILRVEPTPLQRMYYKWIITHNFTALNKNVKGEGKTSLLNVVVELKKLCNHPYLFPNAEDPNEKNPLEALVNCSGKLIVLDQLLIRLHETGHRVLIFSQMVRMLDILADYLHGRGWQYQRLHGSMPREARQQAMEHFNAEGSTDFCFLLSTRAGGLGINLATADTVVIFDSDWNPQNDLQAMARCHRIGQEKVVNIYRLVTKHTVEENILLSAKRKMVLDHLVIQSMDTTGSGVIDQSSPDPLTETTSVGPDSFSKEELEMILKFNAENIFKDDNATGPSGAEAGKQWDIDDILERAETADSTETTPAEDFLNAFKVTSLSSNTFWSDLISPEVQDSINTFEKSKNLGPPPKEEVDLSKPRQCVLKSKQEKETQEKEKELEQRTRKTKRMYSGRDVRVLVKFVKKYGDLERVSEVTAGDKKYEGIVPLGEEVITMCQTALADAADEGEVVTVEHLGVSINAREVVDRIECARILKDLVQRCADESKFRLSLGAKPPQWPSVRWGPKDDSALMLGVHRFGFNWEDIAKDPQLDLGKLSSGNLKVFSVLWDAGVVLRTSFYTRVRTRS